MNTTNNLTATDLASSIEWVADCIGLYAIPYSATVALMSKIFLTIILTNSNLSNNFYKYLTVKTAFDILVNLLGVLYNNSFCLKCNKYTKSTYWEIFFYIFIETPFLRIFMMASSLCDIYLAYNRTSIFVNSMKFKNIHWIILAIFTLSLSLAFFTPVFFSLTIEPSESGFWSAGLRPFARSLVFMIYTLLILFFESIIPLILILILNSILALKFHQYQERRNSTVLTNTQSSTVKVIVMKTTLLIIIELLDTAVSVLVRSSSLRLIKLDEVAQRSISLSRKIVYLLYFINQSIDLFICLACDKNISRVVTGSRIYKLVSLN